MKAIKFISTTGLLIGAALSLTACGQNNKNAAKTANKFPEQTPQKTAKQGGTLTYAIETDTTFKGIFDSQLSVDQVDSDVMQFGNEALFDTDNQYKITNKGPATFKLDKKAKTVTITVKKGVKWSDGKQVVAKDLEYPYEMTANKATNSLRYSDSLANIVGMKAYHNGKAKTISGITYPDGENGRTIVIHFLAMKPGMLQSGNDYFIETAAPYHYLKDVPFSKLVSSDQIRKDPLFFGPYKVSKVVRGQSVTWVPNKYYWRGKPKLNKIVAQVVSTKSASQAIKSHKFDIADVVNSDWQAVKNVMDKNAKMNNKSLRQAIAYAMNINQVEKRYTQGLTFIVPTLIPAQFGDYFDKNAKGFPYNLKKANQLLAKAGYKKKGKWRVQPNGKPLSIHLAAMTGSAVQEPIIQNYIQQWHKIGLHVSLTGGRLIEFNSFYDKLDHDDKNVDMFMAAWSLSSEPSPRGMYSETNPMNDSRFVTKENNKLLDEIDSTKAFNHKYRVAAFHKWQQYMNDEAYIVPMTNSYSIQAVNNKIVNYSLKPAAANSVWYKVGFSK
ncbi:oligopeptide ABC transporter substrate-binding protein [Lactobacillus sp. N54.MGS-719]|uniref:oligopeptide ABC transporter substrate-binding protein n=1 Tax=Lactobacillus sp. N54.MGS-719 TaxID=1637512 RepID=UPI0006238A9E|nr:oligopeptide ABC transporter substrate-binding protein [Lactobacillus sp. N54.MGS-719]